MKFSKLDLFYRTNLLKLMWLPVIILVLALLITGIKFYQTGDIFTKDVSLKGGITASIYTEKEVNLDELQSYLGVDCISRKLTDLGSGKDLGFIIEVSDLSESELKEKLEVFLNITLNDQNFSVEETDAKLGNSFFKQLLIALLFAFILMAIAVFVTFRNFIPSIAVISAAVMDIFITLGIINLLGMRISTAGIVAFLLVIGYSVDTDILLTTQVLKSKQGNLFERIKASIKTGLTMTFATLAALLLGYIFGASPVFKEMFFIIFVALLVDIFSTYLTNAGILVLYCKKKGIE